MSIGKETKALVATLTNMLSTRLELVSLELIDEKQKLVKASIWLVLLLLFGLFFILTAYGLILAIVWDTAFRYWFMGLSVLAFAGGFYFSFLKIKVILLQEIPFRHSIAVFKEDASQLKRASKSVEEGTHETTL